MSALDYWQMTPCEVYAAIDADNWRRETNFKSQHRELIWQIWHLALLERLKTLPTLEELLDPPRTKDLSPEEAEERKEHFEKMKKALPKRLRKQQSDG